MHTACAEVNDAAALGSQYNARGLRCQHRLRMHLVDQQRFEQLCLGKAAGDLEQRLAGEHRRALGHSHHRALEAEAGQPVEEGLREAPERAQVGDCVGIKAQGFQIAQYRFKPRGEQEVARAWQRAHEQAERRRHVARAVGDVGLHHRQLIEIGEQRQRRATRGAIRPGRHGRHADLPPSHGGDRRQVPRDMVPTATTAITDPQVAGSGAHHQVLADVIDVEPVAVDQVVAILARQAGAE